MTLPEIDAHARMILKTIAEGGGLGERCALATLTRFSAVDGDVVSAKNNARRNLFAVEVLVQHRLVFLHIVDEWESIAPLLEGPRTLTPDEIPAYVQERNGVLFRGAEMVTPKVVVGMTEAGTAFLEGDDAMTP